MNFTDFIEPELLTLVPVLNAVGWWLKNKTKVHNNLIPLILTGISVLLSTLYTFGTKTEGNIALRLYTSVIEGILIAASSVYTNQLYKQMTESKKGSDSNDKNNN